MYHCLRRAQSFCVVMNYRPLPLMCVRTHNTHTHTHTPTPDTRKPQVKMKILSSLLRLAPSALPLGRSSGGRSIGISAGSSMRYQHHALLASSSVMHLSTHTHSPLPVQPPPLQPQPTHTSTQSSPSSPSSSASSSSSVTLPPVQDVESLRALLSTPSERNNIPPSIVDKVGRNLHLNHNHPLGIIKNKYVFVPRVICGCTAVCPCVSACVCEHVWFIQHFDYCGANRLLNCVCVTV
jgi:hypothetical protein